MACYEYKNSTSEIYWLFQLLGFIVGNPNYLLPLGLRRGLSSVSVFFGLMVFFIN